MKRFLNGFAAVAGLFLLSACGGGDPESEVAQLLERDRTAHQAGDAEGLAALVADSLVSVDNGRLSVGAILAGARRAVGWPGEVSEAPGAVRFEASVAWDGPPYRVEVISSGDGRMRLSFVEGASFGIAADARWASLQPGVEGPLSDTLETFARGHDFFLTLLHPIPRLRSLHWAGATWFADQRALMLTGRDAMNGAVRLYYSESDTLPLGYEVEDHLRDGATVATTLGGWTEPGGLRTPTEVRFVQGEEVFDYTILRTDVIPTASDSLFGVDGG